MLSQAISFHQGCGCFLSPVGPGWAQVQLLFPAKLLTMQFPLPPPKDALPGSGSLTSISGTIPQALPHDQPHN